MFQNFFRLTKQGGIAQKDAAIAPPARRPSSDHERRISGHFPDRCRWTGDGPKIGRELLILGFTNRSGSNLLADYLRQTGLVHSLGENLNWDTVINRSKRNDIASFPDYMRFLAGAGSAPIVGVKASWEQMAMLRRWNVMEMFPQCRVIFIQRRSILRQAVSMSIAQQTRQWSSRQKASGIEPVYDPTAITRIMTKVEHSNAMMHRLCEIVNLPMSALYYEDLLQDPAGVVRQKLIEVGIDCGPLAFGPPGIARQSDARNESFLAQMKAQLCADLGLNSANGAR